MRLAVALGKTLGEIEESMTSEEFSLWIAREAFEPLPNPWYQSGVMTAAILAPWSKKGKTPKPEDYMPISKRQKPRMGMRAMKSIMSMIPGVVRVFDRGR